MDSCIGISNVVGKVDQELCETPLRSRVVTKDRRESCIAEGLGKTLSKCLPGTSVIAQSKDNINALVPCDKVDKLTEGSSAQHALKALQSAAQQVE